MTVRGSLNDLDVLEILQTIAAGRKSGELLIVGPEDMARFHFETGKLRHAEMGELVDQAVLEEVVGWVEGEFEFRPGVECESPTFQGDIYRALMLALKSRDERLAPVGARERPLPEGREAREVEVSQRLAEYVGSTPNVLHACLLKLDGKNPSACASSSPALPECFDELSRALAALVRRYPRRPLQRVFIEDAEGVIVTSFLGKGLVLAVLAGPDAALGAVSLSTRRLALSFLEEEPLTHGSNVPGGG